MATRGVIGDMTLAFDVAFPGSDSPTVEDAVPGFIVLAVERTVLRHLSPTFLNDLARLGKAHGQLEGADAYLVEVLRAAAHAVLTHAAEDVLDLDVATAEAVAERVLDHDPVVAALAGMAGVLDVEPSLLCRRWPALVTAALGEVA